MLIRPLAKIGLSKKVILTMHDMHQATGIIFKQETAENVI